MLQKIILEDIESFMEELGEGFCFIGSEYKIKISNTYNYIDLLLFNINNNLKRVFRDKTIEIIIYREDNQYVIKYSSDDRILSRTYQLV